jgi:phage terminase large subunit-like protein
MAILERLTRFMAQRTAARLRVMSPLRADQREGLERYCPHSPRPKQRLFLSLDCEEAFYGGAAGGGKTDALLMAALQYVHVPKYSALILRRDTQRLALAGSIMDRAKHWLLVPGNGVKWNEQKKTFAFPSGATIQFGYIDNPNDRFRYASAEYHYIAFEELTEFRLSNDDDDEQNPYRFMFSRLRKTVDIPVPLRVRSASNPGNIGHAFVKRRFVPPDFTGLDGEGPQVLYVDGRAFVPAAIRDNPSLSAEEYEAKLAHLPPVTRARLMSGDWRVAENLEIPVDWIRYYTMQGQVLQAWERGADGPLGTSHGPVDERTLAGRRFATIDTAGTSRDKAEANKGKPPSWSVVGIWDVDRSRKDAKGKTLPMLFLRHVWRDRVGWNELKLRVPEVLRQHDVRKVKIENAHVGQPLRDELKAKGFDVDLVGPMLPGMADGYRGAKLERAISSGFLSMLENGQVFLPAADSDWKTSYESELLSWDGTPEATCDQIDMSSYAAWEARQGNSAWGGPISTQGGPKW